MNLKRASILFFALLMGICGLRAQKIYSTNYKSEADVKVYFTQYKSEAGWKDRSKQHLFY